ncbi:hypothetical protein ACFR97_02285 [Haloplanus litoreus]|uniref:Lipoprotein n=1 Tax=Haloplanus litoreus TaxID=767515 RepID=A0ABD5ZW07_9EURY
MSPTHRTRRAALCLAGVAVVGVAGCAGDGPDTTTTGTGTESADGAATESPEPTDTATAESPELDLREANVVGVTVESNADGYRFDVTLLHDDDGEDGYANWWQVETTAGDRLGRRELLHAHGTREFTRSTTVSVPAGTVCVVVRGHDQTHGYGGQSMLVNVETGETEAVRQGAERRSAADRGCP